MRMSIMRALSTAAIAACVALVGSNSACGQVTVTTVQSSAPAVVGYAAEPAGLFGFRTNYRPIVGNVPVKKTVTVQQTPVYVAPAPVYVRPAPVYVRPAPVYVQPAPVAYPAPATSYLAPVPPSPLPVTSYYTPLYPRY